MSDPANDRQSVAATSVQFSYDVIQQHVELAHQLRSDMVNHFFSRVWKAGRHAVRRLLHRSVDNRAEVALS
ncbi:MAG: hypothetical protein KDG52_16160 [Rhodocyclaceae bacterium]|nr:hypothetical protein [Rhodocyclaceae bacterium]